MADLFTRLTARVHDHEHVPALVPRLPSRFEATGGDMTAGGPYVESGLDGLEHQSVRPAVGPPSAAATVRLARNGPAAGVGEPDVGSADVGSAAAVRPVAPGDADPDAVTTADRGVPAPGAVEPPRSASRPPETAERVTAGRIGVRHAPSIDDSIVDSRIRPVLSNTAAGVPANGFDATARHATATRQAAAQPERPSVHISIGRIEVRATPATPPPPEVRTPAARDEGLSLAAYLRGDDGRPR